MSMTTDNPNSVRAAVLALVLAAHALALWTLLRSETGRRLVAEVAPIFVSVVKSEPKPPPVRPQHEPQPPRPHHPAAPVPAPIVATETPFAPAAIETPVPPPIAPAPIAAAPAAVPASPKPPPLVPPSFGAAYLDNPSPVYPLGSRRFGEQGRVVLRVFVTAQGLPEKVELHASSGFERLDNAALDTVRRWRFVPARRGDENVAAWVLVPISFRLGD